MRLIGWICAASLVACGGGGSPTPGSATFSGTINGQAFAPVDAAAANIQFTINGTTARNAFVVLTTSPAICSQASSGKQSKNTQYLVLALADVSGTTADLPKATGTYPIGAVQGQTTLAAVTYFATDAACTQVPTSVQSATGGSVTLTGIGGTYTGSFNLTFVGGVPVTGTFTAPVCSALAGLLQSSSPPACQ